jgi:vancomycin permeability regulator SanA
VSVVVDPASMRPSADRPGAGVIWRRVFLAGLVVLGILTAYLLVSLWQVWSTGRSDQTRPVDAIVVMGAAQYDGRPSPQLAARLDHVVELWPQEIAPVVVVTGGNQPGDRFTEAEASARYLVDRGIPAESILLEGVGSSTYESLARVVDLLGEADEVLIVTDPYHALRSRLTAQELGLTAAVSPTGSSVVTGARSFERHVREAAGVAVGRVIGFDRLSRLTD